MNPRLSERSAMTLLQGTNGIPQMLSMAHLTCKKRNIPCAFCSFFLPLIGMRKKTFQATYCIKMPKRALGKSYCTQDKKLLKTFYPDINTLDLMIWIRALYK